MSNAVHPRQRAIRATVWTVIVGLAIGLLVGLISAGLFAKSGISSVSLPPINATTTASPSPTPSPTATTVATSDAPEQPKAEINTPSTQVAPGTLFPLSGQIPAVAAGTTLQVQNMQPGGTWGNFPVTITAGDGGTFSVQVRTTRTGDISWRLIDLASGNATPGLKVTIG